MIEIVIFRHAHSKTLNQTLSGIDFEREISEEGIIEIKESVEKLISQNFKAKTIFTSPYKRAVQTAEKIYELISAENIILNELFSPNFDFLPTINFIKSIKENVVIVTHMPLISDIVLNLTGERVLFLTSGWLRILNASEKFIIISSNRIY